MTADLPAPEQVAMLLAQRRADWLPQVFPAGRQQGPYFFLGDPDGAPGESLRIPLRPPNRHSYLKDFSGGWRGDDLALWTRGRGLGEDMRAGWREALEYLGYQPPERPIATNGAAHHAPQPERQPTDELAHVTNSWCYQDRDRQPWIEVVRLDPPGKRKSFRQYNHRERLWTGQQGGTLPDPRPLYLLPELLDADRAETVLMVAGEKCADAALALGYLATTNLGGEQALDRCDLSPLAGRQIILWPDNDATGADWARKLAALLRRLSCLVRIVDPGPDRPDKWDIADAAADMPDHAVRALIEGATYPRTDLISLSAFEFLHAELPQVEPILGNLLTKQGLAMVYAATGTGKTLWSLGAAWAIATGCGFLKWRCERPHRVLYVDGEMAASMLQDRMLAYHRSRHFKPLESHDFFRVVTPDLQTRTMPDVSTPEGRDQVNEIIEVFGSEVVFVDNLSALSRTGAENEAESWLPVQEWILDLRRRGKSVMLVHHAGKGGLQRGTSKRADALDVVIQLRRPDDYEASDGARFELLIDKGRQLRGAEAEPLLCWLKTDEEGQLLWTWRPLATEQEEEVVRLAASNLSQRKIAEETGLPKTRIQRILRNRKDIDG